MKELEEKYKKAFRQSQKELEHFKENYKNPCEIVRDCKYCNSNDCSKTLDEYGLAALRLEKYGDDFRLTALECGHYDEANIEINYCPFCGRKLKEVK